VVLSEYVCSLIFFGHVVTVDTFIQQKHEFRLINDFACVG